MQKVAREMRRFTNESIHGYRLDGDNLLLVFTDYKEKESRSLLDNWVQRVGRLNRESDDFECRLVWGGAYAENNFKTWKILQNTEYAYHRQAYGSYEEAVDDLKKWTRKRYEWIDGEMSVSKRAY